MSHAASTRLAAALALATSLGCAVIAQEVLLAFPNSADEENYLWLSRRLLEGRLSAPAPAVPDAVRFWWRTVKDGRVVLKAPPSWPALLAPFTALGVPWLASPLFAGMTVFVVFKVAREAYASAPVALTGAFLLATNAMFLMNGASFFPHAACLFLCALAWLALWKGVFSGAPSEPPATAWGFLAGLSAGLFASIRPPDAAGAMALAWLLSLGPLTKRPGWVGRFFLPAILGAILGFLPLPVHNHWATGDWLRPGYDLFAADTGTYSVHWEWVGRNLRFLDDYRADFRAWAYDPLWLLLIVPLLWLAPGGARARTLDVVLLSLVPPIVLVILTFPETELEANRYGPRYAAVLLLPMALLVARLLVGILMRPALVAAALAAVTVQQGAQLRHQLVWHGARVRERTSLYRAAASSGLSNAVVFMRGSTGDMDPGDLTRNDLELRNPVLYALDRGPSANMQALNAMFRGRRPFLWQYEGPPGKGSLTALDPTSGEPTSAMASVVDGRLAPPSPDRAGAKGLEAREQRPGRP